MALNHSSADAAAAEKLALTLAGSLILHFALIFGLQIRTAPAANTSAPIIQARLVAMPPPVAAPQPVPTPEPASQPAIPAPQASEPVPLPPPSPPATVPPAPMQPAGAAMPEKRADLPSIDVPLLEDPTYYPAQDVDVHPTALQSIQPAYPPEAASTGVAGSVVLLLLLDESGRVQDISVEESSPLGMFDQSATEAFRHARFSPAQRHGRAVKSRVRIKVNYDLVGKEIPVDKAK